MRSGFSLNCTSAEKKEGKKEKQSTVTPGRVQVLILAQCQYQVRILTATVVLIRTRGILLIDLPHSMDLGISFFLISVQCVALRILDLLIKTGWSVIFHNFSGFLLRTLVVGRRQHSESNEVALDME